MPESRLTALEKTAVALAIMQKLPLRVMTFNSQRLGEFRCKGPPPSGASSPIPRLVVPRSPRSLQSSAKMPAALKKKTIVKKRRAVFKRLHADRWARLDVRKINLFSNFGFDFLFLL